ncbi:MAG: tRNA(Ile)(2)-agmatinylcytidine synthase [Conexivisphaerales archaeon]
MVILHVGIDDTDSKKGMCTTYLVAVILDELRSRYNIDVINYPKLIRLNPNCPFKTRGNAALSFSLRLTKEQVTPVKKFILQKVNLYADLKEKGTDPGVVFIHGKIPERLIDFAHRAMYEILSMKEALQISKDIGAEIHRYKYGRGIIGALAAIGYKLGRDSTLELITYRLPENRGTKRQIDLQSVIDMDRLTFPYTFDNIDYSSGEIKIAPHTPCPVLYGIRGIDRETLLKAMLMVKTNEKIERYKIFLTNQGTDQHIIKSTISNSKPNTSVRIRGIVNSYPAIRKGGHVFFQLADNTGSIQCAAYEPTKNFRKIVLGLVPGDDVEVFGSIKKRKGLPRTVNLEKIYIHKLAEVIKTLNPLCPQCKSRMKNEGKNKGYECTKCKFKTKDIEREKLIVPRTLTEGMYVVPTRARRHLSKPEILYYVI